MGRFSILQIVLLIAIVFGSFFIAGIGNMVIWIIGTKLGIPASTRIVVITIWLLVSILGTWIIGFALIWRASRGNE